MTERAIQERMIEQYLDTIWCIASSRYVKFFVIGYTSRSGLARFSEYKARGFDNLALIADCLTQNKALQLEKRLQDECKSGGAYGPPYKRKYHPYHRQLHYSASAGQGSPDAMAKIHSVYMAWEQP